MSTSVLPDRDYHLAADELLAYVETQVDDWLQQGVIDIDTQRSGGLLELEFPNGSKIVLNKQPPLQEIWLAARLGGFHFRLSGGRWLDTRDGVEFFVRLGEQANAQSGQMLQWAEYSAPAPRL